MVKNDASNLGEDDVRSCKDDRFHNEHSHTKRISKGTCLSKIVIITTLILPGKSVFMH